MSTPPKSVTVSEFLGLGQVPTPERTPCRWVAAITRRRVGAHPALRGLESPDGAGSYRTAPQGPPRET